MKPTSQRSNSDSPTRTTIGSQSSMTRDSEKSDTNVDPATKLRLDTMEKKLQKIMEALSGTTTVFEQMKRIAERSVESAKQQLGNDDYTKKTMERFTQIDDQIEKIGNRINDQNEEHIVKMIERLSNVEKYILKLENRIDNTDTSTTMDRFCNIEQSIQKIEDGMNENNVEEKVMDRFCNIEQQIQLIQNRINQKNDDSAENSEDRFSNMERSIQQIQNIINENNDTDNTVDRFSTIERSILEIEDRINENKTDTILDQFSSIEKQIQNLGDQFSTVDDQMYKIELRVSEETANSLQILQEEIKSVSDRMERISDLSSLEKDQRSVRFKPHIDEFELFKKSLSRRFNDKLEDLQNDFKTDLQDVHDNQEEFKLDVSELHKKMDEVFQKCNQLQKNVDKVKTIQEKDKDLKDELFNEFIELREKTNQAVLIQKLDDLTNKYDQLQKNKDIVLAEHDKENQYIEKMNNQFERRFDNMELRQREIEYDWRNASDKTNRHLNELEKNMNSNIEKVYQNIKLIRDDVESELTLVEMIERRLADATLEMDNKLNSIVQDNTTLQSEVDERFGNIDKMMDDRIDNMTKAVGSVMNDNDKLRCSITETHVIMEHLEQHYKNILKEKEKQYSTNLQQTQIRAHSLILQFMHRTFSSPSKMGYCDLIRNTFRAWRVQCAVTKEKVQLQALRLVRIDACHTYSASLPRTRVAFHLWRVVTCVYQTHRRLTESLAREHQLMDEMNYFRTSLAQKTSDELHFSSITHSTAAHSNVISPTVQNVHLEAPPHDPGTHRYKDLESLPQYPNSHRLSTQISHPLLHDTDPDLESLISAPPSHRYADTEMKSPDHQSVDQYVNISPVTIGAIPVSFTDTIGHLIASPRVISSRQSQFIDTCPSITRRLSSPPAVSVPTPQSPNDVKRNISSPFPGYTSTPKIDTIGRVISTPSSHDVLSRPFDVVGRVIRSPSAHTIIPSSDTVVHRPLPTHRAGNEEKDSYLYKHESKQRARTLPPRDRVQTPRVSTMMTSPQLGRSVIPGVVTHLGHINPSTDAPLAPNLMSSFSKAGPISSPRAIESKAHDCMPPSILKTSSQNHRMSLPTATAGSKGNPPPGPLPFTSSWKETFLSPSDNSGSEIRYRRSLSLQRSPSPNRSLPEMRRARSAYDRIRTPRSGEGSHRGRDKGLMTPRSIDMTTILHQNPVPPSSSRRDGPRSPVHRSKSTQDELSFFTESPRRNTKIQHVIIQKQLKSPSVKLTPSQLRNGKRGNSPQNSTKKEIPTSRSRTAKKMESSIIVPQQRNNTSKLQRARDEKKMASPKQEPIIKKREKSIQGSKSPLRNGKSIQITNQSQIQETIPTVTPPPLSPNSTRPPLTARGKKHEKQDERSNNHHGIEASSDCEESTPYTMSSRRESRKHSPSQSSGYPLSPHGIQSSRISHPSSCIIRESPETSHRKIRSLSPIVSESITSPIMNRIQSIVSPLNNNLYHELSPIRKQEDKTKNCWKHKKLLLEGVQTKNCSNMTPRLILEEGVQTCYPSSPHCHEERRLIASPSFDEEKNFKNVSSTESEKVHQTSPESSDPTYHWSHNKKTVPLSTLSRAAVGVRAATYAYQPTDINFPAGKSNKYITFPKQSLEGVSSNNGLPKKNYYTHPSTGTGDRLQSFSPSRTSPPHPGNDDNLPHSCSPTRSISPHCHKENYYECAKSYHVSTSEEHEESDYIAHYHPSYTTIPEENEESDVVYQEGNTQCAPSFMGSDIVPGPDDADEYTGYRSHGAPMRHNHIVSNQDHLYDSTGCKSMGSHMKQSHLGCSQASTVAIDPSKERLIHQKAPVLEEKESLRTRSPCNQKVYQTDKSCHSWRGLPQEVRYQERTAGPVYQHVQDLDATQRQLSEIDSHSQSPEHFLSSRYCDADASCHPSQVNPRMNDTSPKNQKLYTSTSPQHKSPVNRDTSYDVQCHNKAHEHTHAPSFPSSPKSKENSRSPHRNHHGTRSQSPQILEEEYKEFTNHEKEQELPSRSSLSHLQPLHSLPSKEPAVELDDQSQRTISPPKDATSPNAWWHHVRPRSSSPDPQQRPSYPLPDPSSPIQIPCETALTGSYIPYYDDKYSFQCTRIQQSDTNPDSSNPYLHHRITRSTSPLKSTRVTIPQTPRSLSPAAVIFQRTLPPPHRFLNIAPQPQTSLLRPSFPSQGSRSFIHPSNFPMFGQVSCRPQWKEEQYPWIVFGNRSYTQK